MTLHIIKNISEMRKTVFFIAAMMSVLFIMTACAKQKSGDKAQNTSQATADTTAKDTKTLIAYFSATGTTERVAKMIATTTGGELLKIQPKEPYTSADLDWNDKSSRCCRENDDPKARPAIVKSKKDLNAYDTVYLGFPCWWDAAPRIINTFIETYGLDGKKVIPFMTSGGSTIDNSEKLLREAYPKADWQKGKLLNEATQDDVDAWLKAK